MDIIAKTKPYETLREHTDELRKELEMLKATYGEKIEALISIDKNEFWRLLDIIIEFHDLGKVYTAFQNKLKCVLNEMLNTPKKYTLENTDFLNDIGHNYMSPAFMNFKKLNITNKEIKRIVIQAIIYHHERGLIIDEDLEKRLDKIIEIDLSNKVDLIICSWVLGTIIDIDERNKCLSELKRLLNPNGTIILIENDENSEFEEIRNRTKDTRTRDYNNWILSNQFNIEKQINTYFIFDSFQDAKKSFEVIYGEAIANKIKSEKIEHKIVIFKYQN